MPQVQDHRSLRLPPQLHEAPLQERPLVRVEPLRLDPELGRLVLRVIPDELELDRHRGQELGPEPRLGRGSGRRLCGLCSEGLH